MKRFARSDYGNEEGREPITAQANGGDTLPGPPIAGAVIGDRVFAAPSNGRLLAFLVVTLVATTAWRLLLGRGPLERAFHAVSRSVADALVPRPPVDVRPGPAAARAGS